MFSKASLYVSIFLILGAIVSFVLITKNGPLEYNKALIIDKGTTASQVSKLLYDEGIISNRYLFLLPYKANKKYFIKSGQYLFYPGISIINTMIKLNHGDVITHKITIPEGLTNYQIVNKINEIKLLTGEIANKYEEGYLLPGTYNFFYGDTKQSIIDMLYKESNDVLEELWKERSPYLPYNTKHEAMILASIIEKETGINQERSRVASVFVNRLKKGMKLQTDPTVIYAITGGKYNLNRSLTKKDLTINSNYNTYKNYGLPPSPISNPGFLSIKAALNPDYSEVLYFVANGNGGHNFATSLEQHILNVDNYRKIIKSLKEAKE